MQERAFVANDPGQEEQLMSHRTIYKMLYDGDGNSYPFICLGEECLTPVSVIRNSDH